jgi:rhodanese-related sulfurtransferase
MTPGTLAYTWLGHAGREAAAGNTAAVRYGLLALALLAAIALLPRLIRRWRGEQKLRWVEVAELEHRLASKHRSQSLTCARKRFHQAAWSYWGTQNTLAEVERRLPELAELKNEPVVLVCRTHKMSSSAAALLDAAGFTNVGVLRGGMVQWNAEGHPVEGRAGEEEAR